MTDHPLFLVHSNVTVLPLLKYCTENQMLGFNYMEVKASIFIKLETAQNLGQIYLTKTTTVYS